MSTEPNAEQVPGPETNAQSMAAAEAMALPQGGVPPEAAAASQASVPSDGVAEAAATPRPGDAQAADPDLAAGGAAAGGAAAGAVAAPGAGADAATVDAATADAATANATSATITAASAVAAAPAIPARRRGAVALVVGRRLLRFVMTLALFGAGIAAGVQTFINSQPITAPAGDPAVVGVATPAVVVELANAIGADDADAIRAALAPEIFSNYTADLQNFGLVKVERVETLGTYPDGNRSATALIIHGRGMEKNAFTINLVVLTQDGQIVRLR